jgi:hypothetical protein
MARCVIGNASDQNRIVESVGMKAVLPLHTFLHKKPGGPHARSIANAFHRSKYFLCTVPSTSIVE